LNGQGAIKTRATLVVCPVSLVSQWYDEAIDKTKDGTLKVYQYYCGKRITDPAILRDNDIVITTYQVLVSDMNARSGFAKAEIAKKGRANYVPPLAKLGFWRIILDESHSIKEANTAMAKAVRMLSAHRRWCVSGTPAPLSVENLQSQFKFLGAESIATDMGRFKHFLGQRPQAFAFFRRVQIRHSKEQRLIRHDLEGGTKSSVAADVVPWTAPLPEPLETTDGSSLEGAHVIVGHCDSEVCQDASAAPANFRRLQLAKRHDRTPGKVYVQERTRYPSTSIGGEVGAAACHVEPDASYEDLNERPSVGDPVLRFVEGSRAPSATACAA
jgi:hypothetical protein